MRTGIVSQHANIGPTNKNSVGVESGRLNNYSIWFHHDYTDAATIALSGSDDRPIDSITSKGTRSAPGIGGFRNSNPFTKLAEHTVDGSGQNGHDFATVVSSSKGDQMSISNGTDDQLSARAFTLVYVFDHEKEGDLSGILQWAAADQTLMVISGDRSATGGYDEGKFRSLQLMAKNETLFGTIITGFEFLFTTNDGTVIELKHDVIADSGGRGLIANTSQGGDAGYNFNYIYVVGRSDGSAEMYIRGLLLDSVGAGTIPDEISKPSVNSSAWTLSGGTANGTMQKCYEYIVFDQELSKAELKDIDWYIANKYNYEKGRAFGDVLGDA